jgi:hypothetical protein
LPAFHQEIRRRFAAWPLSEKLMETEDLAPRRLTIDAARQVRLVGGSLLRRKVAIKLERQILFEFLAGHDNISQLRG